MLKAYKVRLKPNNKQLTKLFEYAGCARFAYNWALTREIENIALGGRFIKDGELRKEFTQLKKDEDKAWLSNVSNNVTKQAIKDACNLYEKYIKGAELCPKFKAKEHSIPSFYQDPCKIQFTETHVRIEKFTESKKENRKRFNLVRLCEKGRIPLNCKYYNPRFIYDGLYWYVTVSVEVDTVTEELNSKGIGIDLGIINLATCSDGYNYKSINKSRKVKLIEKRERRLSKSISRKYENNKIGDQYYKTNNIEKSEHKIRVLKKKLRYIRKNYMHQTISEIIKRRPRYICIENLDVKGMMKNHKLSKAIQKQCLYEFGKNIIYKAKEHNINVVIADRFFPSSKRCICCGRIKRDLKLSDRIYICSCGNVIDRDYQASLNLMLYGKKALGIT